MDKKRPSSSILRSKVGSGENVKRTNASSAKKQKTRSSPDKTTGVTPIEMSDDAILDDLDVGLAGDGASYAYPHDVSAYSYRASPHIDYSNMDALMPQAPPPPTPTPSPAPQSARYHYAPTNAARRRTRFVSAPALNFSAPSSFGVRALQQNMDKLSVYLNDLSGKSLALADYFDESRAQSNRSIDFLQYARRLSKYDVSEKNFKLFIDMCNEYYYKLIEQTRALVEILVNVSYSRNSTRVAPRLVAFINMCAAYMTRPMLARLEGEARAGALTGRDEHEDEDELMNYAKRLNRTLYFLLNKNLLELDQFVFYKYTRDNDRGASGAAATPSRKIFNVDVEVAQVDINLYY
ncbi:ORF53 [Lymantria xylina nucleopolyhedrovirus]|uniref:ORF53 n=1 Tax=Lymantria xylina multiple nucleopolyhedrovirus TaxID=2847840 RepID=D4N290_9ABAC|nr:ORF53 [Lymantria xylina nucleopolyhedrovirus]ADD73762.1 ORF53 [Lymantria xylina nucleopolyhedrovirus]